MSVLEAISAFLGALKSITDMINRHEAKILELEAKVQAHDLALPHAVLNPPKLN